MRVSASLLVAAVAALLVVASSAHAWGPNPDVPMCVVVPPGGKQVNLSTIHSATYAAQMASSSQGLVNVSVVMGWCKTLSNDTKCNNETRLAMAIESADGKTCIAAFSALSGPAVPLTNNSFQLLEWSSASGAIATVTVNCDNTVANNTAKVVGIIGNDPFYTFSITFASPAACGALSLSSSNNNNNRNRNAPKMFHALRRN